MSTVTDETDELARLLYGMDVGSMDTGAVTTRITHEVARWARSHGWIPRVEARVAVAAGERDPRTGYIDVVVVRGGSEPDLAIEIDSGDKPWSVTKLRHAAAAGMDAIWIRWGDDEWPGWFEDVDVIQLRVRRRSAARSSRAQLRLWP